MRNSALLLVLVSSFCLLTNCGGSGSGGSGDHAAATHFSVTAPATAVAGTALQVTVTALDASNKSVGSYSGTVHLSSSDGQAVLPSNSSLTNGTGTFSVTLKSGGSQTIIATDTVMASINGTSNSISVTESASHLFIVAPATATAGVPFNFTVTALDASNSTAIGYSGTVHFSSSDGQAVQPADSKLTNGVRNFSVTLKSSGGQTITATDTVTASITGASNLINVTGKATHFSVSAPATVTAGLAFNFMVSALDVGNNIVVGYSGTVHFTSTDGQAALPANSMFTNGSGTFSATLETLGSQTIRATDTVTGSITGTSNSINVSSAATTHFSLTSFPTARAGTAFSFTVSALDAANNIVPIYSGTAQFTSSDTKAVLPANTALTNGTATLSATLKTVGGQTITATDTVTGSITGRTRVITVFTGGCTTVGQQCPAGIRPPCCPGLVCVVQGDRAFCEPAARSESLKIASRFTVACTMETAREFHAATLLGFGIVLVTGGDNGSFSLAAAELFNPETHTFAPAGDLVNARARHTATLLQNGSVLVTGGRDVRNNALASAELFSSETMSFSPASSMTTARESHTATLLGNGKVLIAGGSDGNGALATAELFDPAIGSFTTIASMAAPRSSHTATLLKSGKVLVAGGQDSRGNVLATAEIFDPATERFIPAGRMQSAREFHTATLLNDGKVLFVGGDDGSATLATAELFDPATGGFALAGSMQVARGLHTATLRNDGTVLVVGGAGLVTGVESRARSGRLSEFTEMAELFDPASGTFTVTGSMANPRAKHTATPLPGGEVIVIGGTFSENSGDADFLASAELFQ